MSKILVVDDDAALRDVVRLSLETAGHEVIEAGDGAEVVGLAASQNPDLILCDVRMERVDGYGALAALRQHSATASLPFILMTGQADTAGMRQGMELGADDYLAKPFRIDQLLAAVEVRLKKQLKIQEQTEQKLAALRANISMALPHELLTPLNGILGFADILSTDAATLSLEEIGSMAQAIRESAERLHRLIQNFLLLSHLELHRGDGSGLLGVLESQVLGPVVERIAVARAEQGQRGADLVLELGEARARTRDEFLTKIVEEIIDNAFKFSAAGSAVKVTLKQVEGVAVLRVTDRGRGMKAQHVAEVGAYMQFERKLYEQQGSGLGLAIVRRLAELHGGRLTITSEVGVGTSVEVSLP